MSRLFIVLLFLCNSLFAQNIEFKGKLLDKENNSPVVYANISFLDSEKGISTTEEGTFSMYIQEKALNSKVHISCLNYKDTIVYAKFLLNKVFFLSPKAEILDEVVIQKRLEKSVVLDPVKRGIISMHSSGLRMVAKYFPNTKKNKCCKYLRKVTIEFPRRSNKKSKFRFRIFDVDKKTGKPKSDLLLKNIPVTIDENQTQVELDITDHDIEMPEQGFFVAFEKLFIPFNKYGKDKNKPEEEGFYSPIIGVTKSKVFRKYSRNFVYVKGKWMELPFTKKGRLRGYVPAISVTLSN